MLKKQRMTGPTLTEWAATSLSPETAKLLREAITVRPDGSAVLDLTAPDEALAEVCLFMARLGLPVNYEPARIDAEHLHEQLDAVLNWVTAERHPVEVDLDGEVVHIRPGPAPRETIHAAELANRLARRCQPGQRAILNSDFCIYGAHR